MEIILQFIHEHLLLWLFSLVASTAVLFSVYQNERGVRTNEYGGITELWNDTYYDLKVFLMSTIIIFYKNT